MLISFFSEFGMPAIWLAAVIALLIIEAAVPGLVSIWFALGAFCALIASLFHAQIWLQIFWFTLVSLLSLILTRPLARKYVNSLAQPTNADMLIGRECVVTEDIDNVLGVGAVNISGKIWTARTENNEEKVAAGTKMIVKRIDGVKLIVSRQ